MRSASLMGRELPLTPVPGVERWSILADFVAGGFAGVCCDAILHPVDTVKSRLHVQKGPPFKYRSMFHAFSLITRNEGRRGLYKGFTAAMWASALSHAFMFSTYKATKRFGEQIVPVLEDTMENHSASIESQLAAVDMTSGALAEIFALPFYVPGEVIAKRMQVAALGPARNYNSFAHAAQCIYRTEGSSGFYQGFSATMLRDVPFTTLQFSLFTFSKDRYRQVVRRYDLNDAEVTGLGVIVGAISAFLTNPFDVVKTRFMTQGTGSERKYYSILQCLRKMVVEEGVLSLTRGVQARLIWVAPSSGITLAIYERTSKFLKTTWGLEQRGQ